MNDAAMTGRITGESAERDFMQIRYTDLIGKFLAKYIQIDKDLIQDVFRKGIGLDGSSVNGFSTIDESDMMLFPDRKTLRKILRKIIRMDRLNIKVNSVMPGVMSGSSLLAIII